VGAWTEYREAISAAMYGFTVIVASHSGISRFSSLPSDRCWRGVRVPISG
jgi:hypothetical protein